MYMKSRLCKDMMGVSNATMRHELGWMKKLSYLCTFTNHEVTKEMATL